jgi:hypothetical protein
VEDGTNHLLWRAVVQEQMLFNGGHTVNTAGVFAIKADTFKRYWAGFGVVK